nr:hypothetical protein [Pseudoalteromonas luteoviolacea]
MVTIHNLGFPRIGKKRELKFALESYRAGKISRTELIEKGRAIRAENWLYRQSKVLSYYLSETLLGVIMY